MNESLNVTMNRMPLALRVANIFMLVVGVLSLLLMSQKILADDRYTLLGGALITLMVAFFFVFSPLICLIGRRSSTPARSFLIVIISAPASLLSITSIVISAWFFAWQAVEVQMIALSALWLATSTGNLFHFRREYLRLKRA